MSRKYPAPPRDWIQKLPPKLRIFVGAAMLLAAGIGVCIDEDLFVPSEGFSSRGPTTGSPIVSYIVVALLGGGMIYYGSKELKKRN